MSSWKRKLGIGCGGLLLLAVAGIAWLWIAKPWVPEVELAAPGATGRKITQNGLIGNYYPGPKGRKSPSLLLIGGSEGGLGGSVNGWGQALQKQGYSVLVLSYYRLPGQPQRLELVPLETFYKGLDWLAAQGDVDPDRIGMMGASKGAEAALLVASRRPDVRMVVAAMPSHVVWNGFDWEFAPVTTSSWSEGGKPVPFLPITETSWNGDVYGPTLAKVAKHPEAIIPVEQINGPILLACGEADSLWPSCTMARAAQARLADKGKPEALLLAYKDAGHLGFGIPVAKDDENYGLLAMLGGTSAGNAKARDDGWPKMLAFVNAAMQPEGKE